MGVLTGLQFDGPRRGGGDRMLGDRADALMGGTENSPEETELAACTDAIDGRWAALLAARAKTAEWGREPLHGSGQYVSIYRSESASNISIQANPDSITIVQGAQ